MAGRRFTRRYPMRPKAQYGWTAADPGLQSVGTTTVARVLVGIADWERGGGVTQNATMVGIRGFISYAPQVLQAQVWTYIGIYDEGETIDDPDNIVTLYTENILWTYTYQGPVTTLTGTHTQEINVKVKRKITQDSAVYIVSRASAASGFP